MQTHVFYVKIRFSIKYLSGQNEHAVYMVKILIIAVVYQPRRENHYGQKTEIGAVHQPIQFWNDIRKTNQASVYTAGESYFIQCI